MKPITYGDCHLRQDGNDAFDLHRRDAPRQLGVIAASRIVSGP